MFHAIQKYVVYAINFDPSGGKITLVLRGISLDYLPVSGATVTETSLSRRRIVRLSQPAVLTESGR